eukprot:CAMPEP_0117038316 /NCGR_PEP_ID=MMETSP0472-20121206/26969_1 /TAXON_ID=693140 ORGANISM="Tiarina fusus, Strain LIS" /NCGR_SAMPLE_ID=MMETSP0472 /ASSEMBLY_ACC=CAM_ASM_000603 /LENGTH=509 /DNA_ID=CAMNT_0004748509 /DNA_START=8 /DNA_END=1537 /DNA_ORIENTATION=+
MRREATLLLLVFAAAVFAAPGLEPMDLQEFDDENSDVEAAVDLMRDAGLSDDEDVENTALVYLDKLSKVHKTAKKLGAPSKKVAFLKNRWNWLKKKILEHQRLLRIERRQMKRAAHKIHHHLDHMHSLEAKYMRKFQNYAHLKAAFKAGCASNRFWLKMKRWHWKILIGAHRKLRSLVHKYVILRRRYTALPKHLQRRWRWTRFHPVFKRASFLKNVIEHNKSSWINCSGKASKEQKYVARLSKAVRAQHQDLRKFSRSLLHWAKKQRYQGKRGLKGIWRQKIREWLRNNIDKSSEQVQNVKDKVFAGEKIKMLPKLEQTIKGITHRMKSNIKRAVQGPGPKKLTPRQKMCLKMSKKAKRVSWKTMRTATTLTFANMKVGDAVGARFRSKGVVFNKGTNNVKTILARSAASAITNGSKQNFGMGTITARVVKPRSTRVGFSILADKHNGGDYIVTLMCMQDCACGQFRVKLPKRGSRFFGAKAAGSLWAVKVESAKGATFALDNFRVAP